MTREEVTAVTSHPAWVAIAEIVQSMEDDAIQTLRFSVCSDTNHRMMMLAALKSEIQQWSDNKDIWNGHPTVA